MLSFERSLELLDSVKLLVSAARSFPDEVGPRALELLKHDNSWVRMIAWATVVAAGPGFYCVDELAETMRDCFGPLRPFMSSQNRGNGF